MWVFSCKNQNFLLVMENIWDGISCLEVFGYFTDKDPHRSSFLHPTDFDSSSPNWHTQLTPFKCCNHLQFSLSSTTMPINHLPVLSISIEICSWPSKFQTLFLHSNDVAIFQQRLYRFEYLSSDFLKKKKNRKSRYGLDLFEGENLIDVNSLF